MNEMQVASMWKIRCMEQHDAVLEIKESERKGKWKAERLTRRKCLVCYPALAKGIKEVEGEKRQEEWLKKTHATFKHGSVTVVSGKHTNQLEIKMAGMFITRDNSAIHWHIVMLTRLCTYSKWKSVKQNCCLIGTTASSTISFIPVFCTSGRLSVNGTSVKGTG